jgi:GH24 family phage-related lysozyme (muramidase)
MLRLTTPNQSGPAVKALQRRLAALGFDPNGIDGVFGAGTDAAVRAFQAARGLKVDGIVGPATQAALNQASNGKGPRMSAAGLEFLARHEGFSGSLYNDPAGHCTIGFGHLVHRGPINGSEPAEFKRKITRERGLELLREDADEAAAAVRKHVSVDLKPHQRDALISFTYNVGGGALQSSTLVKLLNAGDYDAVPKQLMRWTLADGKRLPGLVRRREAEGRLFSRGDYST